MSVNNISKIMQYVEPIARAPVIIDGTIYEGVYLFINYQTNSTFIPWPDVDELIGIVNEMNCNTEALVLMESLQLAERYNTIMSREDFDLKLKGIQK